METVLLTILLIVTVAMVAVILLQNSEGGALGIGGGPTGMMTARGAGNLLTKSTKWLAVVFLSTCLLLGWFAANRQTDRGLIDEALQREAEEGGSQLPQLPTIPEDG
jgi:preprotein translocase subunit SecG